MHDWSSNECILVWQGEGLARISRMAKTAGVACLPAVCCCPHRLASQKSLAPWITDLLPQDSLQASSKQTTQCCMTHSP